MMLLHVFFLVQHTQQEAECEAVPAVYFWFSDFMIPGCEFGISVMNHDFLKRKMLV